MRVQLRIYTHSDIFQENSLKIARALSQGVFKSDKGRLRAEVNPLPFYTPFWHKRYPFYIPFIEKRYPFHIPTFRTLHSISKPL